MYHAHFALSEEPFGVSPDPRFFFQTDQHREALATLYYAILQRRGLALLTGRPGLGKTSVLMRLLKLLEGKAKTAYLPHPYFDAATVLESTLASLGLDTTSSATQNHHRFHDYLLELHRSGQTCVIVFDEAQDMNRDTLEAIRMLSNFETPTGKLVQIVLAGQPRLVDTLKQADCEQIRQRLNVVARLTPLSSHDVQNYIAHRLQTVGSAISLFDAGALEAIAIGSGGVPRNVNTICFNALTLAYASNFHRVRREEVDEALRDLDLTVDDTLVPNVPPSAPVSTGFAIVNFSQREYSFRPALIGAAVALLAAGTFFFQSLAGGF
jgi:type II secretory pathway predicted ATPase ExeA